MCIITPTALLMHHSLLDYLETVCIVTCSPIILLWTWSGTWHHQGCKHTQYWVVFVSMHTQWSDTHASSANQPMACFFIAWTEHGWKKFRHWFELSTYPELLTDNLVCGVADFDAAGLYLWLITWRFAWLHEVPRTLLGNSDNDGWYHVDDKWFFQTNFQAT